MFSTLRNNIKYCFLPLFNSNISDKVENATETEIKADKSVVQEETGWERLKAIFQVDEFGKLSSEVTSVLHLATMSSFVGGMYGGIINSRTAYLEFMRSNEATTFKNHLEAKKKLQDAVSISFGKGAWKWGWRVTLFSTTFAAIATVIQTYRGEYGISEYVAAGTVSGAMYKFNAGPRGWITGAALGSVLGLFCGGSTLGILKLTGLSIKDARYWQTHWKDDRDEYLRKGIEDYLETNNFAVIKIHNNELGEKGKNLSNLDEESSEEKIEINKK